MAGESNDINGLPINRVVLWFAGVAFSTWAVVLGTVYIDFKDTFKTGIRSEERIGALQKDIIDAEKHSEDRHAIQEKFLYSLNERISFLESRHLK